MYGFSLNMARAAVEALPSERRGALLSRVEKLRSALLTETWDAVEVANELDGIRAEAELATSVETTGEFATMPSEDAFNLHRAAQQAAAVRA